MMKNSYSYKLKFYLTSIGGLLIFVVSYNLAFKKTVLEVRKNKDYIYQLQSLQNAPMLVQQLEFSLRSLNGNLLIQNNLQGNEEIMLLEKANSLIKDSHIQIVELPHNDAFTQDGFIIKTQTIIIRGTFLELLNFLHSIGKENSLGNICSVEYFSQKESESGRFSLKMKIYFQTITQLKTNA